MYTKSLVLTAALGFVGVNADFELVTAKPAFPAAPSGVDGFSWSKSVANDVSTGMAALGSSIAADTSFVFAAADAASNFHEFVKTATTLGIPAEVTGTSNVITFTTVPSWYSAIPSDYQSVNDKYNSLVSGVYASAFAKATGGAVPSGTESTGTGITLHGPPSSTSSSAPSALKPNSTTTTGPPTTTPSGAGSQLMVGASAFLAAAGAAVMFAL